MTEPSEPVTKVDVLLVEDSPTQALLVEVVLSEMPKMNLAGKVDTGEKALQYLRREGEYADAVRPSLILLDINLPGISGIDVLDEVKADPALKTIPVVMLTASSDDQDIAKSYGSGASTYISKPVKQDDFQEMVKQFASYWSSAAKFPTGE